MGVRDRGQPNRAVLLAQAVFPLMQANKWGRIIDISSRAGRTLVCGAGDSYHT
jgi:NAD(P)-dependent dehydrogenase (short-subunit alcohol dehydrogenase family)